MASLAHNENAELQLNEITPYAIFSPVMRAPDSPQYNCIKHTACHALAFEPQQPTPQRPPVGLHTRAGDNPAGAA
jgi:hypothetical protein